MTIIDVDSHFDVTLTPENHPLRKWADRLPTVDQSLANAIAGDLRRHTPEPSRPDEAQLAAFIPDSNLSSAQQASAAGQFEPRFASGMPEDRVAWFDTVGIDYAFMNPGGLGFVTEFLGDDEPEAIRCVNDFMAERLENSTDRMLQVSIIDWNDLDGAVAEMARMRARGSRAFWVRAQTYHGMSPAHPDWDTVWSAATDLGMIAILHIGNTPARFDGGWGNAGWELPNGTGLGGFFRFANSFRHQAAEMMLGAMLYGGVFGRHPNLTILTEELGVAWIPFFVRRCEMLAAAGPWPFELSPPEMLRRNVRATPLIGLGDTDALTKTFRELPEMLVFSSDYPHGEGNVDPIALYEPELSALDADLRDRFLGENMLDCFARMGDPLPAR
jgi:predicted TIM-barrel fold metal-dependent hydrolase